MFPQSLSRVRVGRVFKVTLKRWLDRLAVAVDEHQILAWVGLAIAVATLVASGRADLGFVRGLALLGSGAFGGALVLNFIGRRRHPIRCTQCIDAYRIEGAHGERTKARELTRFQALSRMDFINYAIWSRDGEVTNETFRYRNLGRNGRTKNVPFRDLDERHLILGRPSQVQADERTLRIVPPAPIKRKDHLEIEWLEDISGGFPADVEIVSKRVLFPVDELTFDLKFVGGNIDNVHGIVYVNDLEEHYVPLVATRVSGDVLSVRWECQSADRGERYVLSWRWN